MGTINLEDLPPEIQALIGGANHRSPIRKPLTDLREPTTAKGRLNRPHFEWSADPPPEGTVIPPYPRLFWDANGVEIKIASPEHEASTVQPEWTSAPPMAHAISAVDQLQKELAALSVEDRAFVMEAQRKARLERLHGKLSLLSDGDIASLAPVTVPVEVKAKKSA